MKFSAQEEYGLRCMLQFVRQLRGEARAALPRGPGEKSLTIGEIAEIEGITPQYAGKLIRILRMGGLLESVRGRHGGYRLARPADRISVGEVLAALGGRVFQPDYCSRYSGERKICVHTVDCTIRSLWGALQETVDRVLSHVMLTDLVSTEKDMTEWLVPLTANAVGLFPSPHSSSPPLRSSPPPPAGSAQGNGVAVELMAEAGKTGPFEEPVPIEGPVPFEETLPFEEKGRP